MPDPQLTRLLRQLKRRRVFRVAAAYAVVAWIVIEAADVILPALRLPDWTITLVVVLALLGLPVALVLGWAYDLTPEGVQRTVAPEPSVAEPEQADPVGSRRRVALGALAAVLVLGAAGTWLLLPTTPDAGPPSAASAGETVAVLPFTVRGGDEVAYLGEGMVNLLSTNLDGIGELRGVDPKAVLGIVGNGKSPAQIAERLGARRYVTGTVTEAAGQVRITARLRETAGGAEPIAVDERGPADEIFEIVDRVTAGLVAEQHGRAGAGLARVTTRSLPALKAYLEGEGALRRLNAPAARAAFEEAVSLDPAFALAHYGHARAVLWGFDFESAGAAIARAIEHVDRLPRRERRLVRAYDAYVWGRHAEADRLYREILADYPNDVEALYNLGEVRGHFSHLRGGTWSDAREWLSRAHEYQPENVEVGLHLGQIAAFEGRVDDADGIFGELNADASGPFIGDVARDARSLLDDPSPAEIEAVAAGLRERPAFYIEGLVMTALNFEPAAGLALLGELVDPDRPEGVRAAGHAMIASRELLRGRPTTAWDAAVSAGRSDPATGLVTRAMLATSAVASLRPPHARLDSIPRELAAWDAASDQSAVAGSEAAIPWAASPEAHVVARLYLLGLICAADDTPDRALAYADSLDTAATPPELGTLAVDLAAGVRAEVARRTGDYQRALTLLEASPREIPLATLYASPLHTLTRERFLLAELLHIVGRNDEALDWYATFGNGGIPDAAYLAPAYLRRAEIHEARGERARAAALYAELLDLWVDAEPPLADLVEDVRSRLARLAGEAPEMGS